MTDVVHDLSYAGSRAFGRGVQVLESEVEADDSRGVRFRLSLAVSSR